LALNSSWSVEKVISCPSCAGGDNFGADIALSGNDVLVTSSIGAKVWSYKKKNGVWSENGMLKATTQSHSYGSSVALTNQLALVGDIGPDGTYSGSVNIFQRNSSDQKWIFLKSITVSGGSKAGDFYGYSVALTNSHCVVGRPESGLNYNGSCIFSGSAYVYDLGTIGAYANAQDISLCVGSTTSDSYNNARSVTLGGASCNLIYNPGTGSGYFANNQVLIKNGVLIKSGSSFIAKSTTGCTSFNTSTTGSEGGRKADDQEEMPSMSESSSSGQVYEKRILKPSISPNPTEGKCFVVLSNDDQELLSIKVITMIGGQRNIKLVKIDEVTYEIDLQELASGILLLEIETSTGRSFEKILKR
jgi:hypothetical protein